MAPFTLRTPAKVNWVLEVLKKRDDGFHELALVFQAVGLWDELAFSERSGGFELAVTGPPSPLPADGSNLVAKAAGLFFEATGIAPGARIELKKGIPLAAGLGGGSSDAAATLLGLDRLFETHLPWEKLKELAGRLGSDVPFFLKGGTALGRGRGEVIEPWEDAPEFSLVLVKPEEGLSTPAVYGSGKAAFTDGAKARDLKEVLSKGDPQALAQRLFNGLEPAAFSLLPRVESLKNDLLKAGALGALVSGSGPTVFALCGDGAHAARVAQALGPQAFLAQIKTVTGGPRIP